MKQLATLIIIIILLLAVRHDLKYGLLTSPDEQIVETVHMNENSYVYFKQTVNPGDTLISIIETKLAGSVPVPISQAIDDFKLLNKGLSPEEMQVGEMYKFPLYENKQEQ